MPFLFFSQMYEKKKERGREKEREREREREREDFITRMPNYFKKKEKRSQITNQDSGKTFFWFFFINLKTDVTHF